MKIAIITSIFNDPKSLQKHKLHIPKKTYSNADYFAFVDEAHNGVTGWKQVICPSFSLDEKYKGRRDAKIYKIMPQAFLPDYDYWIWVDPTHEVVVDPAAICRSLGDKDMGVFKHTDRNCAYQEASEVLRLGVDHADVLLKQVEYFLGQGYPKNNGLYELPVSVRKNTKGIRRMNMMWWELICRCSSRDQISFPFVLWKTGINPHIFDGLANGGLWKNELLPQVRWKYE
jgi:hypothetical protein